MTGFGAASLPGGTEPLDGTQAALTLGVEHGVELNCKAVGVGAGLHAHRGGAYRALGVAPSG